MRGSLETISELASFGDVLRELVKRDLKVRYKRSVLGMIWTMLNPLLMMSITTVVFSQVFHSSITNFPIYMLTGYVVWGFFSQATTSATSSILDSAGLSRKVYVPPALFPLAAVVGGLINFALSLVPLALLMVMTGTEPTWALLFLPVAMVPTLVFTYGMGLFLAAASVFFYDTLYTYQVLLTAWMYLTPLFYPADIVPQQWSGLFNANPMLSMVELVRAPVYEGRLPDMNLLLIASAYALGALVVGWTYFERSRNHFASYL